MTHTSWPEREGVLRSPGLEALGLVAGYTTRALGSLGTSAEGRAERERALAARLGCSSIARARQVHGAAVVRADGALEPWPEADALWTDRPGVLLGVGAADCVPVLLGAREGPVGAAHAGWEGTSRRVTQALVRELAANGARPEEMVAAIGPSIGPCCYVIREERAATIRERLGPEAEAMLRPVDGGDGRWSFDLWAANLAQLRALGVREIEVAGICTRCGDPDLWSYRAREERGQGTGLGFVGRPAS